MSSLTESASVAIELATAGLLYRLAVSPLAGWCAVRLGAGRYPETALNGSYPEGPPERRNCIQVGAVLAGLVAVGLTVGAGVHGPVSVVPPAALAIVLWKHLTIDYDAALDLRWQRTDRLVVLATGIAGFAFPSVALAATVLACGRLGAWTHHTHVCVRIVKAAYCVAVAAGFLDILGAASAATEREACALMIGIVYLSHYVTAAWSKARLGRFPWSWVLENRTDLLAASSYAWGWARFLPGWQAARVINGLRRVAVPLNAATLLVESLGLVAFAGRWCLPVAVAGSVLFNIVVAVTSGLLFWENMLIGIVLGTAFAAAGTTVPYGLWPWTFSVLLTVAVLGGWSWRPNRLGWWDTPLSEKVTWTVETTDGARYGLYNDFLSPHDREYGRAAGNPLVTEPFVTFPLGGVEDEAVRDLLVHASPLRDDIERAKSRYGISYWRSDYAERHCAYLRQFLKRVNSGVAKNPLPRCLRWLKAPGGHLYYAGDLPRYRRTCGRVRKVIVGLREDLYSTESQTWFRLRDQKLLEIDIPACAPATTGR